VEKAGGFSLSKKKGMKARYKLSANIKPLIAFKCYRGFFMPTRGQDCHSGPCLPSIPSIWYFSMPNFSKDWLQHIDYQLTPIL
jgi:hypothetical protein